MFLTAAFTKHDFLREPDKTYTTLSVPGTVPGRPANVNDLTGVAIVSPATIVIHQEGTFLGTYRNVANLPAGFVQKKDGNLTIFIHPGASTTMPTAVNNYDVIVGYFAKGTK